jgi:hypothetical protein
MVSPSPATGLQPPRPITSLWKAARLDRLAGVSVNAREAGLGFADASEGPAGRRARLAEQKAEGDAVAVPRLEPLPSSNRTVEIEQKGITLMQSKTATAKAEKQESRRERPGKASGAIEETASVPTRRDREREAANAVANREPIPPAAVPAPVSLRNAPGIEVGRRTAAEKNSSLHIGKIEVQIVPPPRSSSRPAPSPNPAGRLARGYTLWTNWQQQ